MSKRRSSSYKTIGAISGHFPSAAERKLNAAAAANTEGAIMARAIDAADLVPPAEYLGKCPACGSHTWASATRPTLADCVRCEGYRADPDMYLDEVGEWCSRG